jgi:serine phosphatase RsbU (regulator of sigma subunit)
MEIWGGNEAVDQALSMTGIDAWVYSRPLAGHASGGDVHYVSMCGGGKIVRFALMDVAGHGGSASDLAAKLRALMRKHINRLNQAGFAAALNREFTALGGGQFATALLTSYFAPTDQLVVLNAGHPPPLWYRAAVRAWGFLEPQAPGHLRRLGNIPLGIIEPTEFEQFAVQLGPGDLVLIYTDALIESASTDGELLGSDGLLELAGRIDPSRPHEFCKRLVEAACSGPDRKPADDDLTLILLLHTATDPPERSLGDTMKVIARMLGLVKV